MDRPICTVCNKKPVMSAGNDKWKIRCWKYHRLRFQPEIKNLNSSQKRQRKFRKTLLSITGLICSMCKFEAEHICQLDLDHIDGNNKNNNKENLQVICANCHRLKTFKNKDWENRYG